MEQGCGPVFRQEFAAGSQADVGFRIDEAEEGDGPQDIAAVELGPMFQGVPGMGMRALTGMDWMPSSARLMAMSRRSSQVSPCR